MDIVELVNDYNLSQNIYLHNQAEISAQVEHEEIIPSFEIYHGFHMTSRYTVKKSITNENSFYDSFRQGLRQHGIFVTVDQLKEICELFTSNPPDWFKNKIIKSSSSGNVIEKTWNEFTKNVYDENKGGNLVIKSLILCNEYNLTLYLIESQIIEGDEKYITQIIDKESCTTIKCALFFSGEAKITIVDFGSGHYEPLVNKLADMLIGKFGHVKIENGKIKFIKPAKNKSNETVTGVDNCNHDTNTAILDVVNSLEITIKEGDINRFKELIDTLYRTDRSFLSDIFQDSRNKLKNSNLVVLACKYNKLHILQYIIHESDILYHLPPTDAMKTYEYKDDAIYYATKNMNIDLLDTLYDHFLDDLHWSCNNRKNGIIESLKELNAILIKTWMNCLNIIENMQMLVDLHCLIEISKFQIELYTELTKIKYDISNSDNIRIAETDTVVKIMLTVLQIYEKYNSKNVRLPIDVPGVEIRKQILLADKTSIYMKNIHEYMYNLYYRKLDSNALLILDNLHYLQQRLELPSGAYQEIESAIYYFINRVYEDWRLFLPKNREKTKVEFLVDTYDYRRKYKVAAIYDQTKMLLGPVLYLSRQDFRDALNNFKAVLENTEIKEKVRVGKIKLPVEVLNKLTLLPLMRDNFSLKKILVYLESLSKVDLDNDKDFGILMIERTIQVVGELLKTTNESIHLDSLTKYLLELEIPSEIITDIKKIRDLLSHCDKAKLLRKIYIETEKPNCLKEVLKDLKDLKERIYVVVKFYNPVVDKWIVEKGLSIIRLRKEKIPVEDLYNLEKQLLASPSVNLPDKFIQHEDNLMEDYKISRQLLREVHSLKTNEDDLTAIHDDIKKYFIGLVTKKIDKFSEVIKEKLKYIKNNKNMSKSDEFVKEQEFIIKLSEYIVTVAGFLDNCNDITYSQFSEIIINIRKIICTDNEMNNAYHLLGATENPNHEFIGIKSLKATLEKHYRFIIDEELRHVLEDFKKSYGVKADEVYKEYEKIFKNVKNNTPIPGADLKKLCSLNIDDKSKKIIRCLDMGSNRDSKLKYCFQNRLDLLKRLLEGKGETVKSLALRYKHDEKFLLTLEVLLIDMMNILKYIKETDALTKSNKMYTDANIRNILEHSEPLLEVIGKALDPNDFATELAEKALKFVQKANDWMKALEKIKK